MHAQVHESFYCHCAFQFIEELLCACQAFHSLSPRGNTMSQWFSLCRKTPVFVQIFKSDLSEDLP